MARRGASHEHASVRTFTRSLRLTVLVVLLINEKDPKRNIRLKEIWSWPEPEPEESVSRKSTNQTDDENSDVCYRAWRLHLTFVNPACFSVLREEHGFARGAAHGWSALDPATIDLQTLKPMQFRDLFTKGTWPELKTMMIKHILTDCWDRNAARMDEPVPDREVLEKNLVAELDRRQFLLTYGPEGTVVHLSFYAYEIHPYALGGVWLVLPMSEFPEAAKDRLKAGFMARVSLPDDILTYPDIETMLMGVVADPENDLGNALKTDRWMVGAYRLGDRARELLQTTNVARWNAAFTYGSKRRRQE